jgi:DNA-binding MarR family transcriptional regulator
MPVLATTETLDFEDDDLGMAQIIRIPGISQPDLRDVKLGFLIHDVSRLRRSAFDQLMKPLGVTRSQWWVIAHVSRHDGMMQTELADLLDVGKVTLGGLIDRLTVGGWVERRPDPDDRRVKRIYLTPAAQDLIRDMRAVESEHNRKVLKGFSRAERAMLTEMLSRIKSNLRPDR